MPKRFLDGPHLILGPHEHVNSFDGWPEPIELNNEGRIASPKFRNVFGRDRPKVLHEFRADSTRYRSVSVVQERRQTIGDAYGRRVSLRPLPAFASQSHCFLPLKKY